MKMIKVLVVPPSEKPYVKEIPHTLSALQEEVGGDIEVIYPFADPVGLICNESGKLLHLPLNRALRDDSGEIYDIIAGTFLVVGLGEEDFVSLGEDMIKKYAALYGKAEMFIRVDGRICDVPEVSEK